MPKWNEEDMVVLVDGVWVWSFYFIFFQILEFMGH